MRNTNHTAAYEKRYKYKLNMLEPGTVMVKCIGFLLLAGIVFTFLGLTIGVIISFAGAGAVFLVLMVLLLIEDHQDRVLTEIALRENREKGLR